MTALFVAGTGTDVGKTFVAAGLIRHLRRSGRPAGAVKPVMSGFDGGAPESSDAGLLLAAMGAAATQEAVARISPWRFKAPLAPDMAARLEGRAIDFDRLVAFAREAAAEPGLLLIEGAGGIMTPLTDRHTMLDWVAALDLPVILVAGSYLGTISHSLTAFEALHRCGLAVTALVVSESPGGAVGLDDTVSAIARFVPAAVIGMPRLAGGDAGHPAFARLAALL